MDKQHLFRVDVKRMFFLDFKVVNALLFCKILSGDKRDSLALCGETAVARLQVFGADPAFADHIEPVVRRADDLFGFGVPPAKYQFNDVFVAVVEEANDIRRRWFFFGIEMIGGEDLVAGADITFTIFQNTRRHNLNEQIYLCVVLNRSADLPSEARRYNLLLNRWEKQG